jgi:hypothetical protein
MTQTKQCLPQRRTPKQASSRRGPRSRHASSFSDAVVAVYIHEISARHARKRAPAAAVA